MEELNFKNNNPGAVQFGNFINYYNFHPPENRISLLPTDIWNSSSSTQSSSLTVLDVGCNAGDLTVSLYEFLTKTVGIADCNILGIDIDPTLIERACEKNVLKNCTFKCCDIMSENKDHLILEYLNFKNCSKFDVVFCFSITMWIHLNHGDDGLKRFLKKVSELSDLLVLEPQPWKCYRTAVKRIKSSNFEFSKFKELKIRHNVEEEIEHFILDNCDMVKVKESVRTKWDRKLLIFKRVQR